MRIIGVGTDILLLRRIADLAARRRPSALARRILSPAEHDDWLSLRALQHDEAESIRFLGVRYVRHVARVRAAHELMRCPQVGSQRGSLQGALAAPQADVEGADDAQRGTKARHVARGRERGQAASEHLARRRLCARLRGGRAMTSITPMLFSAFVSSLQPERRWPGRPPRHQQRRAAARVSLRRSSRTGSATTQLRVPRASTVVP